MTDHKTTNQERDDDHTYDISTVCRLTGLSSANLRVWEKRYEAVTPTRSTTGRRQYSRRDLQRLTLLKTLIDLGHSIKCSAKLPMVELERRIKESARPDQLEKEVSSPTPAPCRICVIGSYLGTIMDGSGFMPQRAVKVAEYADLESAEQSHLPQTLDLLIIECSALFAIEIPRIKKLMAKTNALRSLVVYSYTPTEVLRSLENPGTQITAIQAPVSSSELKVLCEADLALANRSARAVLDKAPKPGTPKQGIPEGQFSERQLALISQISPSVKCECPHHLVSLLKSLNGFETYSLECENANIADAEIHAYLHKSTAQARSIVEDALKVLLEFEGLSPDDNQ